VDHKAAILKALNALQEFHTKEDEVWTDIENAKKDIEKEKNEEVLKAKRLILYEEFKKELDQLLPEEK
jgi:ribonuclease HI